MFFVDAAVIARTTQIKRKSIPINIVTDVQRECIDTINPAFGSRGNIAALHSQAKDQCESIHNAAYGRMRLMLECRPSTISSPDEIRNNEVRGAVLSHTLRRTGTGKGFVDFIEKNAKAIGDFDTVVRVGNYLHGFNSEWMCVIDAMYSAGHILYPGMSAVIVGEGSTARAVAYGLRKRGLDVDVHYTAHVGNGGRHSNAHKNVALNAIKPSIIIDAIPANAAAGVREQNIRSLLSLADIAGDGAIAIDATYNSGLTPFIKYAKTRGLSVITGSKIGFYRHMRQIEILTGMKAPAGAMELVFADVIRS